MPNMSMEGDYGESANAEGAQPMDNSRP